MNSFELNKIFGAILGTLVFVMGVGFIADEIYAPIEGHGSSYELPEPVAEAPEGAPETPGIPSIAARLQTASVEAGEGLINRCQACHDFSSANANRVGPGLYDIINHPIGGHEGFDYSDALASLGAEGEVWDYEHLDAFIENPRAFAPGTKMSFPGLADPEDRADLIAYLRTLSEDPAPLPEAPAEEAAAPAEEPAAGEAAVDEEFNALLASVTPEDGEALIVRCVACHDTSPANANRVGPGLYDIVNHPIAAREGFAYSEALAAHGEAGEVWSPANLSAFLESPQGFARGTKMGFPGLPDPEDRAALIVYLNSLSENPAPLVEAPAGEAAPAEEPAAPAEEPAAPAEVPETTQEQPVEEPAAVEEEPEAPAETEAAPAEDAAEAEEAAGETQVAAAGGFTIFDGVFTQEQAARGGGFFGSDCAACHANTARGSSAAPGLIGYTLDSKYAGQPLFNYFDYMRSNMPPGNAGWFTDQEYADIVAYLLSLHGAPAGDSELEGTEEALTAIEIVPTPQG